MKRILTLILALILVFQPCLAWLVYADEASNSAEATSENSTAIENNNNAIVNNNIDSTANTGSNEINPTPTPEATPTSTPEASPEVIPLSTAEPSATPESTSESTSVASEIQTIEVKNNNEATVSSDLNVEANSGENQATGGAQAEISTGDVEVIANLANIINENLTGSAFYQFIINVFDEFNGNINLASNVNQPDNNNGSNPDVQAQNFNTGEDSSHSALASATYRLAVVNDNLVLLENNFDIEAQSGANIAEGSTATINTGNVNVLVNLFNLLNTNLTGKNWFFSVVNVFNNLNGNIILPYEKWFYENGTGTSNPSVAAENSAPGEGSTNVAIASSAISTTVTNNNTAEVTNNLTTTADSGNNQAVGQTTEITTGQADIENNLLNVVNTNITGNNWLFIAVNLLGKWTGQVINGSLGFFLFNLGPTNSTSGESVSAVNQNTGGGSSNFAYGSLLNSQTVVNNNQALLTNNVNVLASSGSNKALTCGLCRGSASVNTGNVSVKNNVGNVVNTNITGNNWYFAMINIFGNWAGDLVLARPDLAVSVTDNKDEVNPGGTLTYTITYKNLGEVLAENVILNNTIPENTSFISATGGNIAGRVITWDLGILNPGQEGSQEVAVKVDDGLPVGTTTLADLAQIATSMDEPKQANNSASDQTIVYIPPAKQTTGQETTTGGINVSGGQAGCNDTKPGLPTNFTAVAGPGTGQVTLSWTPPIIPYNYFLIAYSDSPSWPPKWGNPDIGNVTSFTVSDLGSGTYWFWLRAGNGCMPGDFVGPISPGAITGIATGVAPGFLPGVLGTETLVKPAEAAGVGSEEEAKTKDKNWWWVALALFASLPAILYKFKRA